MTWNDIACIIVVCTSANHLGLIKAVEKVIRHRLPIVNCVKCSTFWGVLLYGSLCCNSIAALPQRLPVLLALSFLASYLAIWLELLMFSIDTLYNRIYDTLQEYSRQEDNGDIQD